TFAELDQRVSRAAEWLSEKEIRAGDVVALVGSNSAALVVLLLGVDRLGATAALLGSESSVPLLEQALRRAAPRAVCVEARSSVRVPAEFRSFRFGGSEFTSAPRAVADHAQSARFGSATGERDFAFVYTSGTTGPMKAARVTNRRALLAATAFGHLVHRTGPGDIVYCALPLHHSSALLLGLGVCLVTGAGLALRRRFSASAFWADVHEFRATVFLYVGELPAALLAQPPSTAERDHSLRLAVGNGLRPELWRPFRERFGVRHIHEFYAATEFPGAIVNLTGRDGSVGHIPLERARGYRLVRVDVETLELVRDARGRAIECAPGEPGELVLRLRPAARRATGDYAGYVGEQSHGSRLARDLFRRGDLYCRSGDLLRRDRAGNYWFVDRLGDSFRFKGENVSSRELERLLRECPGVDAAAVVGVRVPGIDGQPPLAVLSVSGEFEQGSFERHVAELPSHARPCFLRFASGLAMTESMKVRKRALAQAGVDPAASSDTIWYRRGTRYERLTPNVYACLSAGDVRF
ncbi:MAG TPA: AMP-binding protein, partial [Polyangiaceae bacterium]